MARCAFESIIVVALVLDRLTMPEFLEREGSFARRIGLLIDNLGGEYETSLRWAIRRAAASRGGWLCTVAGLPLDETDPRATAHNHVYDLVRGPMIDGVICVSSTLGVSGAMQPLIELCRRLAPMPVCSIGAELEGVPSLLVDNRGGTRALVEHAVAVHGARRIAFVSGPKGNVEARERFDGFRDGVSAAFGRFDESLVVMGDFGTSSGTEAVRTLLDERRVEFDTLIAASDQMAMGAMEALRRRGIDVPQRVAVLGFDDVEAARYAPVALSTSRQPFDRMAKRAVALVLGQAEDPVAASERFGVQFIARASCGCDVALGQRRAAPSGQRRTGAEPLLGRDRQHTVEMLARVGDLGTRAGREVLSRLLDAMREELDGSPRLFARVLDKAIVSHPRHVLDLDDMRGAMKMLRQLLEPVATTSEWHMLVNLLHEAASTINAADVSFAGRRQLHLGATASHLNDSAGRLSAATSTDELFATLEAELGGLGVVSCAMWQVDVDAGSLRATFRFAGGSRRSCDDNLDPLTLFASSSPTGGEAPEHVLVPLCVEAEFMGVMLLAVRPDVHALVLDGLRDRLAAALGTIELHQRWARETRRRQRAEQATEASRDELRRLVAVAGCAQLRPLAGFELKARGPGAHADVLIDDDGGWLVVASLEDLGGAPALTSAMLAAMSLALVRSGHCDAVSLRAAVSAALVEQGAAPRGWSGIVVARVAADGRCEVAHHEPVRIGTSSGESRVVVAEHGLHAASRLELSPGDELQLTVASSHSGHEPAGLVCRRAGVH